MQLTVVSIIAFSGVDRLIPPPISAFDGIGFALDVTKIYTPSAQIVGAATAQTSLKLSERTLIIEHL